MIQVGNSMKRIS